MAGLTLEGHPRVLLADNVLLSLGYLFAKGVQSRVPSPPWDAVALGVSEDGQDILALSLVRGHVAVVYRIPLEDVRGQEYTFLDALPRVVAELERTYQASLPDFRADGLHPDC